MCVLALPPHSPTDDPSSKKLGSFLVQSQFQGSVHSSAMFLTAAAQNLLCMKLATELGVAIASPWLTWFSASVVPATLGLLITPFLIYKVRVGGASCSVFCVVHQRAGRRRALLARRLSLSPAPSCKID